MEVRLGPPSRQAGLAMWADLTVMSDFLGFWYPGWYLCDLEFKLRFKFFVVCSQSFIYNPPLGLA